MRPSPHNCTVHHCVIDGSVRSYVGMGQLQPMGEQWPKYNITASSMMTTDSFYELHFKKKWPCLIRNGFDVPEVFSDDDRMKKDAGYWNVIVEQQNRIIHDHREPFWVDWNLSKFLRNYKRRPIYLITENPPRALDTPFPEFLRCNCEWHLLL